MSKEQKKKISLFCQSTDSDSAINDGKAPIFKIVSFKT